MVFTATELN